MSNDIINRLMEDGNSADRINIRGISFYGGMEMEVKVSPLIDRNPRIFQPQAEPQNNSQKGLSGANDYNVKEAPVIKLIRMMRLGKNVDKEI